MTRQTRAQLGAERGEMIAAMLASGKTQREVGRELGICNQRVSQLLHKHRSRLARLASSEEREAA